MSVSAHPSRLQADPFTFLADGELHGAADDTTLRGSLGLALANEEPALGPEPIATLVAYEAAVMPLSANCRYHNLVHDVLFASPAARSRAARVALETPCKPVPFHERSLGVEGLDEDRVC